MLQAVLVGPDALTGVGTRTFAQVAVLGAALAATALAYVRYFRVLATAGATDLLLVTPRIPVGAIVLGIAFVGERLAGHHGVGMALIGLGLAAIDGRPLRALRATAARARVRAAALQALRADAGSEGDR